MGALFQEELLNQSCTGSVTGASFDVPDVTMLSVNIILTYTSGSTFSWSVYLEGSCDGGTNWHPLVFDFGVDVATALSNYGTPRFQIMSAYTNPSSTTASAIFKHLGVSKIRPRVVLNSGTATFTIKIVASGK